MKRLVNHFVYKLHDAFKNMYEFSVEINIKLCTVYASTALICDIMNNNVMIWRLIKRHNQRLAGYDKI